MGVDLNVCLRVWYGPAWPVPSEHAPSKFNLICRNTIQQLFAFLPTSLKEGRSHGNISLSVRNLTPLEMCAQGMHPPMLEVCCSLQRNSYRCSRFNERKEREKVLGLCVHPWVRPKYAKSALPPVNVLPMHLPSKFSSYLRPFQFFFFKEVYENDIGLSACPLVRPRHIKLVPSLPQMCSQDMYP